jgi:hypothetical protein
MCSRRYGAYLNVPFRYLHQGHEVFPLYLPLSPYPSAGTISRLRIFLQCLDIVDTRNIVGRGHAAVRAVRNGWYDLNSRVLFSKVWLGFTPLSSAPIVACRRGEGVKTEMVQVI